ncbi:hypothetical protein CDAR_409791 [Caerostris darwini]|uniref:Uncharacterized protein n=1 Tax=Caerostris darwini TaxID=1538125 RepID=A0AAV4RHF8_9ARAC|nr:hypothetical protein CDAR_409791 [Caerostris darwini]
MYQCFVFKISKVISSKIPILVTIISLKQAGILWLLSSSAKIYERRECLGAHSELHLLPIPIQVRHSPNRPILRRFRSSASYCPFRDVIRIAVEQAIPPCDWNKGKSCPKKSY